MLLCPASIDATAHAVRKRIASISACSANATICAHRQRRTSCEKSAASKLKRCKRLLQALLQAVRVPSHPALVLLRAPVPARQTSASLPLADSFSTCGKKRRLQQKSGATGNYFSWCCVFETCLAMPVLARTSRSPSVSVASKSFVPYVRYEINLLIAKGITCIPALEAHN